MVQTLLVVLVQADWAYNKYVGGRERRAPRPRGETTFFMGIVAEATEPDVVRVAFAVDLDEGDDST